MRNFPSEEALIAAYWRKLARSIERTYRSNGRRGRNALAAPERFRQSAKRADPTSLRGENGSDLAAQVRPVRFELTACATS